MQLLKLRLAMVLTMTLLFGFLAGVFGLIVWQGGLTMETPLLLIGIVLFVTIITALQWWGAPSIIKWSTRMKPLDEKEFNWIHKDVEELSQFAEIKKPKLWIVADNSPNAFAFGRTKNDSNIAIHSGLLRTLNKDEVRAVLAHEIGHVKHWDVVVITLASMIPLLVYYLVLVFSPRDNRRGGSLGVFFGALFAQFLSRLLVMFLSRTREYYADAFSAAATKNPALLQNALKKIAYNFRGVNASAYQSKAAFYISSPEESVMLSNKAVKGVEDYAIAWEKTDSKTQLKEWFSTHPLTYKRLEALEKLKGDLPDLRSV